MTSVFICSDEMPNGLIDVPSLKKSPEKNAIYLTVVIFWFILLFIIVVSLYYFSSKSTVFNVTANVEKVTISPYFNQNYPSWNFSKAILHSDCGEESNEVSGELIPSNNTYIDILRVQKNELIFNLDNDDSDSVGRFITDTNKTIELDDCATIRLSVEDSDSFIYPIEGQIKLGVNLKEGTNNVPIVYSGNVTIIDKEFFTRNHYSVAPYQLKMGDIFEVEGLNLKSVGFVQVDNDKGIKVTFNSKGSRGYIIKYKTEPVEIRNGFWTKIYNDPSLIILWFFGLAFYKISKTVIRFNLDKVSRSMAQSN